MARVLITGAAGFAGAHLAEFLRGRGHEVWGLVRDPEAARAAMGPAAEGVSLEAADLTDVPSVRACIARSKPEQVYHLAAFSSVGRSFGAPLETYRTNVLGTSILLLELAEMSACPRALIVSSAEVYGDQPLDRLSESAELLPCSPYGASKAASEMIARGHVAVGQPIVVARSFNHLGPRQSSRFVTPTIARQIAQAELGLRPPTIEIGNVAPVRDFSSIESVCRVYEALMERGAQGETYNVGSGVPATIDDVLQSLVNMARVPLEIRRDEGRMRRSDPARIVADTTKLERAIGFAADSALPGAVAAVLAEHRAALAEARDVPA